MKRAVVTVGLGFGDEGKGATVDFLCRHLQADLVVRYCGGSQCGHNVQLPDGRRHTFSQFGAGTLAGAATYLGPQMIVNLPALRSECEHLTREMGVKEPHRKLWAHPDCLVTTAFHQMSNQVKELYRNHGRHGSCGHGIGETRLYWLKYGDDAIHLKDVLETDVLEGKLELLRQRTLIDLQQFVDQVPAEAIARFDDIAQLPVARLAETYRSIVESTIAGLRRELPPFTSIVFEGAQGVLLDEWHGFHPYTTWSTVTPRHALELLEQVKVDACCVLGVTRAFSTRHGAGPFPTFDRQLTDALIDPGNPSNEWQGSLRVGPMDFELFHYAVQAAGRLDGLVVNHVDQAAKIPVASKRYQQGTLEKSRFPNLAHQERLTSILSKAQPEYTEMTTGELLAEFGSILTPVITAAGPTYRDRAVVNRIPFRAA